MEQFNNEIINNCGFFSPKIENFHHLNLNKIYKNNGNYSTYSKYTKSVLGSPINLYSHSKITNYNFYSPKSSNISTIISPIHRNYNKIRKSSSQKNIISRPLTSRARIGFPGIKNNSFLLSPRYSSRHNTKKKIIYDNPNDNFMNKQKFFNMELEKLYQETHQIKKLARILAKELSVLKKENAEKDKLLSIKEKQINNIIMNNAEKAYNNINTNDNDKSFYLNNSNNKFSDNSSIFDDSIYVNAILSHRNSSTGNIFFKIKKEIKKTNNEIKSEKNKIEKLRQSIYNTKVNELKIESDLLEQEINKIKVLLSNALEIKEKNDIKESEIQSFRDNIAKQDKIIKDLITITKRLENEINELNIKIKKINNYDSQLNQLKKKNENLTKQKVINNVNYTIKLKGNPIIISSLYKNKISELKKSIKFYKRQIQYSDMEINKLKDKRKKLIDTEKLKSLKFDSNILDKNNNMNLKINITKKENILCMNEDKKLPKEDLILELKNKLKESKELEKKLEEKKLLYQKKLKEIDIKQENEKEEDANESQIEFGIDSENPYYIDDEKNVPEVNNKFTSSQFNQFTYVLFKNFESKGIIQDESKKRVINPLIDFINQNNISILEYPSNNFDLLAEVFTNIILDALNVNNTNNHILTKIFVSALLFNSGCDLNKFIEYFSILFGYTKNYSIDEEKYKNQLKTKYKEETIKIISCISSYINNELKNSIYFPLLKLKEILDNNGIQLKDKYIEFLFYYMKKFDDPESKLSDLKFSLLYDIISIDANELENITKKDISNSNPNSNSNLNIKENNLMNNKNLIEEEKKNNSSKKEESNILEQDNRDTINKDKEINEINGIKKSPTEGEISNRAKIKNHTDKNEKDNNSDDYDEEDEDSMTEITNEEYIKQLTEAICLIQKGIKDNNTNFSDLMSNVIQKRKITGVFYECITIEDFNEQLKSINVLLTDLKLSCLCSKYSIPNELRLIDKNKIEKDIIAQSNGKLKFEEEDDDDN